MRSDGKQLKLWWERETITPMRYKTRFLSSLQIKSTRAIYGDKVRCVHVLFLPSFHNAHFFMIKFFFSKVSVLVWWDSCNCTLNFYWFRIAYLVIEFHSVTCRLFFEEKKGMCNTNKCWDSVSNHQCQFGIHFAFCQQRNYVDLQILGSRPANLRARSNTM